VMKAADVLVDIGPGAGQHGGQVVAVGPPSSFDDHNRPGVEHSITALYLNRTKQMPRARSRPVVPSTKRLILSGITKHNISNLTIEVPLGRLVAVTGVSGSGKSTLVHDSLAVAVQKTLAGEAIPPHLQGIQGVEHIDKLIEVDQSPIGRSPRSIPATFCDFWDEIRKVYAATRDAKQRGFNAARFSFNSGPGRCEACGGNGRQKLEMSFLADVYVACSQCRATRFNRATLAVKFKGKTIADCLEMSIAAACEFFSEIPKIRTPLECLVKVGLGYMALGQPSNTVSGGEAQRVKLSKELSKTGAGNTLYLLDEPTTGLHSDDVARLLGVLQDLVDRGNSVLVVEHHMELVRCCDWILDIGPGGGKSGGKLIGQGMPNEIMKSHLSPTAAALKGLAT
jgi:excinuclease ABC subunit A